MDSHYARIIEHEQERVGAVLRDRASMARRALSPDVLILEHAPDRIADNLVWDGDGWWIHMHLAPYGNGLLFQVVTGPDGRVVDLERPMAEQFPLLTWTSSMLVDLGEMAAAGRIARDVVDGVSQAARRLVVGDARHRAQLDERMARPPDALDKVIAWPRVSAPQRRSVAVLDFDEPLPLRGDFRVEQEIRGILYRSRPILTTPLHDSCLPAALARLGVDAARFCAALGPGDVAVVDDAAGPRPVTLRVGTGLVGVGALRAVRRFVRGRAVVPALVLVLGDEKRARALAFELHALPRGRDEEGRSLHHVVAQDGLGELPEAERGSARRLAEVVADDPEGLFGLDRLRSPEARCAAADSPRPPCRQPAE
jgi:hypothetical protein